MTDALTMARRGQADPGKGATIRTGDLYRSAEIRSANTDDRTVELSFSSEVAVERWYGWEVLDHATKSVRMDWLASGRAPFLLDHNIRSSDAQIGVVEKAWIANDRKGRAVVRFSNSPTAMQFLEDIKSGIRSSVSVGYRIHKMILEEETEDGCQYRAVDWEPYEISLVTTPADTSVGVSRHAEVKGNHATIIERKRTMETQTDAQLGQAYAGAERSRVTEILNIAQRMTHIPGAMRAANEYIGDGRSISDFQKWIVDNAASAASAFQPMRASDIVAGGASGIDMRRYSLTNVFRHLMDPRASVDVGYEREVGQEVARQFGKRTDGFLLPLGLDGARSITKGGGGATGSNLIATQLLSGNFIDVLRARMVTAMLGARLIGGLVGDAAIPRKTQGATAYWIGGDDTDSITPSTPGFDQVNLSPHTVGAAVGVSRKMLLQSTPDIELLVRQDLMDGIAVEIDRVAIQGDGTGNQPKGLLHIAGINTATYANGGAPTFADIVGLEGLVATANADRGALAYIAPPTMSSTLKTTPKIAGAGATGFVWEGGREPGVGMMNTYDAWATSNAPAGSVMFGDWSAMVIGNWGTIELRVDESGANALKGSKTIVALMDVDVGIRTPKSFAVLTEAP